MPDIDFDGNEASLLALSTFEILNVDDDFLSKLRGANSSCNHFSNENIKRRLSKKIEK